MSRLGRYAISSTYVKNGSLQQSIELHRCSISQTIEAVTAEMEAKVNYLAINRRDKSAYEFK